MMSAKNKFQFSTSLIEYLRHVEKNLPCSSDNGEIAERSMQFAKDFAREPSELDSGYGLSSSSAAGDKRSARSRIRRSGVHLVSSDELAGTES